MVEDRRREQRYVVDGLNVMLDGRPCAVLDVSSTHLRLVRTTTRPEVHLRFQSDPELPHVDFQCTGRLARSGACDAVYAYAAPSRNWPSMLARFDSFRNVHIADLED
ncbi:MAG: hypothetical protein EA356_17835 [Geminicoccaceae bacterium]|nr:MAG: hypothetical protein EA356_17835 [Geminicoccaceae bacterium]